MRWKLVAAMVVALGGGVCFGANRDVEELRRGFPRAESWEKWVEGSGEGGPDFSKMEGRDGVPDLLEGVRSAGEWEGERKRILGLFERWYWGSIPAPPREVDAKVLSEVRDGGVVVRRVVLTFGGKEKASLHVEVMLPGGGGRRPLFLTQRTQRAWALMAVRRGYAACVYDASDGNDDTESFKGAYPGYDWGQLARRAFAGGRALDYCLALPEVDGGKVVMAGHSRNGKQALIAGAIDTRIAVVISGSSGLGGAAAARFQGEAQSAESIESMTRMFPEWYHPRLRFFSGREDRLPVDANSLLALIAPRVCLISTAMNDPYEMGPAVEEGYWGALPVFQLLGVEKNLFPMWREGGHEIAPGVVEDWLDFCDSRFGRGRREFSVRIPFPLAEERPARTFDKLRADGAAQPLAPAHVATTQAAGRYGLEPAYTSALLNRLATTKPSDYERVPVAFGEYLAGDVYMPMGARESGKKYPGVLYLHPFSSSRGYSGSMAMILNLARRGFVVMAFDQIGHGSRVEEAERFYERHPQWSLMGKMVRDSGDALDCLLAQGCVDSGRVYAAGYSLGAAVGLRLLAEEPRLCGGAFAGVGNDGGWALYPAGGTGVRELVGACGGKVVMVVTPVWDRHGVPELGGMEGVEVERVEGFDGFGAGVQRRMVEWLEGRVR